MKGVDNRLACWDCGGIYAKLRVCRECGKTVCQTCLDAGNHDIEPNPEITGLWVEFIRKYPSLANDEYAITDTGIEADWIRALIKNLEQENERLKQERSKLVEERLHFKRELRQASTTSEH